MKRIITGFALLAASAAGFAQTLIGIQFNGNVVRIDPMTGAGAFVGATGFPAFEGIAYVNGRYYAIAVVGPPAQLVEINPQTGAAALTGVAGPNGCHSLSNGPAGTLYAIQDGPVDTLFRYKNGVWTPVGSMGFANVRALVCTPSGAMFAWDTTEGLLNVDLNTGTCVDVNPAIPGSTDILGLSAASNTTLVGGRNQLYSVDALTGAVTLIGSGGYVDVNGVAWEPTQCLAVSWPGSAFRIDYMNGLGMALSPTGFVNLNSMAYWKNRFYTATSVGMGELAEVNPLTGVATGTAIQTGDLRALSEGPGGKLYGISPGIPCSLKVFDEAAGTWVNIGNTGTFFSIQGLAYDKANNIFYAWDVNDGLLRIDPATAATVDVNPALPATVSIQSLDYGPDGVLYGCHNVLFRINTPTGVAGPVGGGGFSDVRGIAFGKPQLFANIGAFTIVRGSQVTGTFNDTFTSDNVHWQWRPGPIPVATLPQIQFVVTGNLKTANPSKLKFTIESSATVSNIRETVELFNFHTGTYQTVQNQIISTSDTTRVYEVPNPSEFCGTNGTVQVRLSYKSQGPTPLFPWRARIDMVLWEYVL